jgi:N6-L-threonylcarbamoyladenine synthase
MSAVAACGRSLARAPPGGTSPAAMTQDMLTVLGIETSCDETAAAVVRLHAGVPHVIAERVASQVSEHALFGGVVPEIAARAHVERLDALVRLTMEDAGLRFGDLDGVAATAGPGLIGGVMVGLSTAKAISLARGLPLVAVNHLEGHALSPLLSPRLAQAAEETQGLAFPWLLLLASGGHCQFILVRDLGVYERLGSTLDDAAGEAFDKTAKLLGLVGQGGPAVEALAAQGDPRAVRLPRPLLDRDDLSMSFSGLKTAVRIAAQEAPLTDRRKADICASFQTAVADILAAKSALAMQRSHSVRDFVVAGGVAANRLLRARLEAEAQARGWRFHAPPLRWCTDNAAMIALAGALRLRRGLSDPLDVPARARWPLDEAAAASAPVHGGGRRGAKA